MADDSRPVRLEEMLLAREKRSHKCRQYLLEYGRSVIQFTMNVPGPVKASPEISLGFEAGFSSLLRHIKLHNIRVLHIETNHLITGPEGYVAVDIDAERVKRLCIQLEEGSMQGRLYDIDVHSPKGTVSREDIGLNPRKCLLCGQNAKLCSRSRRHSAEELMLAVHSILCGSPAANMERA